jgi:glutathione S-transferase
MLKILGRNTSSNVQKVLWACEEMGIAYDREDYGLHFGGNDTAEYKAMNPNGLVPTIIDDGFVLWESNSICRYLAAKHDKPGGTVLPDSAQDRASAERWMDWQLTTAQPNFGPLFLLLTRRPEAERTPEAIAEVTQKAANMLKTVDAQLGKTEYLACDRFSLGDIPLGIITYRWFAFDNIKRPDLPNLKRWYNALTKRPAYKKHIMIGI